MADRHKFIHQSENQRLKELLCILGNSSNLWSFEAIRTQCLPDFQRQYTKRLLDSNPMLFNYYPESALYSAKMSRQQFEEHLNKCKKIQECVPEVVDANDNEESAQSEKAISSGIPFDLKKRIIDLILLMGPCTNQWSFKEIIEKLPNAKMKVIETNPDYFMFYPQSNLCSTRLSSAQYKKYVQEIKVHKETLSACLLAKKYPEVDKKYSFLLGRMFEFQDSKDLTIHYFGENRRMVLLYKLHVLQVLNEEKIPEELIVNDPSFFYVPNVGFNLRPFIDEWNLEEFLFEMVALFLNSGNGPKHLCQIGSHWRTFKRKALREGPPKRHYDNFSRLIMELLPQMFLKVKDRSKIDFCLQDRPEEEVTNERLLVEILRIKQKMRSISSFEVLFKNLPEFCKVKFATRVHLKAHCKLYPLLYISLLHLPTSEFEINDKIKPFPCVKSRKERWHFLRQELAELSRAMLVVDEDQDLTTFDKRVSIWAGKIHDYCKKPDESRSNHNNEVYEHDKKIEVVAKLRRPFPKSNDKPVS